MTLPNRPPKHQLRVAAARADFLETGRPAAAAVSDVLAASWVRSRSAGVDADRTSPTYSDDIDTSSRLARCARPVIDQLGADIPDVALVIALTDHKARLVERLDISTGVARLVDRVEFAPGFSYAEDTMGTNGVGTAIQSGQPVSIVGHEHYSEQLQPFACTAAPIIDPITGRIEGILDVSTVARSWSPLLHTLVKSAAKDISSNLFNDRSQAQQVLFNTYLHADARCSKNAVFGFGSAVVMANANAQTLFTHEEQAGIRDHARFLMSRRDKVTDTITLSSGRVVRFRGTRIVSGDTTAGIVVVAELAESHLVAAARSAAEFGVRVVPNVSVATADTQSIVTGLRHRRIGPAAVSTSPSWARAQDELQHSLAAAATTLVLGEPGSGKFTLTTETFHADRLNGRSVCLDAGQLDNGVGIDAETLVGEVPDRPTLVVARNIENLGAEGAATLTRIVDAARSGAAPVTVVATVTQVDGELSVIRPALLSLFRASVQVPPLRYRTEDLDHLIGRLLRELAPLRHVHLSPVATRTLAAYPWPGNVTQLRDALGQALRQRPVGEIQVDDLPRYCQTNISSHNLTPIQVAERDALISALREHDGNRVAAAAHVGISRSSLYRKIKTYGIVG
ncbi:sigma-54-dependent Fis family transcriptional regulator [Flexivirga caeni]|uniref:GAF domain-containing protein n=1 Tax=Flexivirga caeni TaxID=2294115 RepID=A0A3M9M4H9_9MICO|nr:helix-turn-helix domain-containing protein [Flexivirga caeni]RNI20471.1 GAF domain-containing protein [Flexivirga caeni]